MTHTPTPWKVELNNKKTKSITNKEGTHTIVMTDYCTFSADIQEANANFIVKAVNCHAELVEALRDALELLEIYENDESDPANFTKLKQALAKAEGK